jgi:dCMP deaminase
MTRPTRIQTFMDIAHVWSKRSTCHRLNVGAIVVVDGVAVSHGYNGVPAGAPHCSGNDCPGKMYCQETIHAETNAISRIPATINLDYPCHALPNYRWCDHGGLGGFMGHTCGKKPHVDMYVTDSPCENCAQAIVARGFKRVFFANPYRITDSLNTLRAGGVEVYRVTPAGYVVEWFSKNVVEL